MRSVIHPDVSATTSAPFHTLALGVHTWTVRNDEECHKGTKSLKFSLSDCGRIPSLVNSGKKDDEFICDNGLCVDLDKRCDGVPDCQVNLISTDYYRLFYAERH